MVGAARKQHAETRLGCRFDFMHENLISLHQFTGPPFFVFSSVGHVRGRVGTLPRENVCTENLTPLLKLLPAYSRIASSSRSHSVSSSSPPTSSATSLAGWLRPLELFDSPYHSLALRSFPVCSSPKSSSSSSPRCSQRRWIMSASVTAVLAPTSLPARVSLNTLLTSVNKQQRQQQQSNSATVSTRLARSSFHHRWSLSSLLGQITLGAVASVAHCSSLHLILPRAFSHQSFFDSSSVSTNQSHARSDSSQLQRGHRVELLPEPAFVQVRASLGGNSIDAELTSTQPLRLVKIIFLLTNLFFLSLLYLSPFLSFVRQTVMGSQEVVCTVIDRSCFTLVNCCNCFSRP